MTLSLVITFRETLEASLVVGIILAYLGKTGHRKHDIYVWLGVAAGLLASMLLAILFQIFAGGFTGRAEEIYEGITMLTAAALISWMIVWMLRQRRTMRRDIEQKVETHIADDHPMGLFFLTFVSIAREGIETIIFMQAAFLQAQTAYYSLGAVLGVVLAIAVSYVLFKGLHKLPLSSFFSITSVILILFAAGLVAHGIHELEEAALLPPLIAHVWDTNAILNENGTVGSLLKAMFGYNGNPSLLEVMGYMGYLGVIGWVWRQREITT